VSRQALGPTQPPIQCAMGSGGSSLGVNQLGHEADLSPPSSVEFENALSSTSTPPINLHGMTLNQAMDTASCHDT
jgi:hypothetical protein